MKAQLSCVVELPPGYRPADIIAFYRRDMQALSEQADPAGFRKGMLWSGRPACLSVKFDADVAVACLSLDGRMPSGSGEQLTELARRILGLTQSVLAFEQRYSKHPIVGAMVTRQAGLRVPVAATPFEALTWAITGQQVSVAAAVSIRRRLIATIGQRHSSGLLCYPDPAHIAMMTPGALRSAGFSAAKTVALLTLSRMVAEGELPLDTYLASGNPEDVRERLLAIKGIGPWTADYTLLRGYGWMDGSLHGDVAVRRALQILTASDEKIGEKEAQRWLSSFSPWRALIAAHLWTSLSNTPY